jgi:hypothetical protein
VTGPNLSAEEWDARAAQLGVQPPPPEPPPDWDERNLPTEERLARLHTRTRQHQAERLEAAKACLPSLHRLDELLDEPDEQIRYRIDRLWPTGGRIMLNAAWKAGKTTVVGNLVRSLVDAEPFLGAYDVAATGRPVVVFDDELDLRTIRRWYRDQHIEHTDQVYVVSLRGEPGTFNLLDETLRDDWAALLLDVHAGIVLLDCLSPVLAALGLDENHPGDVRRFLTAFDTLLMRAGAEEGAVIHHAGHNGERGRGASALRDWPDAEWMLVREKPEEPGDEPDPSAPRYFKAYGRDVDEPEQRLNYDPNTRRLAVGGASRRTERADRHVPKVVEIVTREPGATRNRIVELLDKEGISDRKARKARERAVELGMVRVEDGPNNSKLHYPVPGAVSAVTRSAAPGGGGAVTKEYRTTTHPAVTADSATALVTALDGQCTVCGEPLDEFWTEQDVTVHPGCEEETA